MTQFVSVGELIRYKSEQVWRLERVTFLSNFAVGVQGYVVTVHTAEQVELNGVFFFNLTPAQTVAN